MDSSRNTNVLLLVLTVLVAALGTLVLLQARSAAVVQDERQQKVDEDRAAGATFRMNVLGHLNAKPKWEYKVLSTMAEGHSRTGSAALSYASVTPSEGGLNELGLQGWELVASYLEMETAFPNFGKDKYVTGLQSNVRPQRAVLLFRRQL